MDYRKILPHTLDFEEPTDTRSSGWSAPLARPVLFQTPRCVLLSPLDASVSSLDLNAPSDFAQFVKGLEQHYVQWIITNKLEFFGNESCTSDRFNSHIKEDSVRFSCKGAVLFDEGGKVVEALPSHTVVSTLVEVGDGWFWQGQWGIKMKCTQVKAHGQACLPCGFIEDDADVPTITCGFVDD